MCDESIHENEAGCQERLEVYLVTNSDKRHMQIAASSSAPQHQRTICSETKST